MFGEMNQTIYLTKPIKKKIYDKGEKPIDTP